MPRDGREPFKPRIWDTRVGGRNDMFEGLCNNLIFHATLFFCLSPTHTPPHSWVAGKVWFRLDFGPKVGVLPDSNLGATFFFLSAEQV